MKRVFNEKVLVLALFGFALFFFYIANEDAKKLGVLQKTHSNPSLFISNQANTTGSGNTGSFTK